ncbi:MAG: PhnD/SsuA/transferrin family substrate-binding protein [Ahrensia sp.]|nr:PhnD/SsuA/transferrin family substrate-binding protein [Ahrensia sp.]
MIRAISTIIICGALVVGPALSQLPWADAAAAQTASQTQNSNWRQELGRFRIGIVSAGRPVLETRRVQPFRAAMQRALGLPVEVFAAADYNELIEAHRARRIEYGVYSAAAFSAAWLVCQCVEPLVGPVASDGAGGFSSVLVARRAKAAALDDLRDAVILVPGKDSISGSLFPFDRLARRGIDAPSFGWTLVDKETMDATLEAFAAGEGDAMFGWAGHQPDDEAAPASDGPVLLDTMQRLQPLDLDISVLWTSAPVPFGPHVIRADLPAEIGVLLRPFLMDLVRDDPLAYESIETRHTGGFREINREAYRPIIDALRKAVLFSTPQSAAPQSD